MDDRPKYKKGENSLEDTVAKIQTQMDKITMARNAY